MFSWDALPYDVLLSTDNLEMKESKVTIYPNPATNQLNIVWEEVEVEEIKIISFQGRVVKSVPTKGSKGQKVIDINGFSPGVYFVSVGSTMRKLVVD
jgi:hypothetical protein